MAPPDDIPCGDSAPAAPHSDAVIAALQAENERLRTENAVLTARLADLERRLGLTSRNSGKPPSSDGLKKPPRVRSLREPTAKQTGGQPGHLGKTLRRTETPDTTIDHYPTACAACGKALTEAMAIDHLARQVFDLPEPKPLLVTEHRAHGCRCGACGAQTRAAFPDGVSAPVQYGPRIGAIVLYLLHDQLLPEKRLARLMADLFGVTLVAATIARISRDGATRAASMSCASWSQQRRSSNWMNPASGSAARHSGCTSPRPCGSPSTGSRPSAAACWQTSPASSCMTTGSPITP